MFHCSQIGGNQGKKSIGTELDAIQVVLKCWRKSNLIVRNSDSSDAGSRGRRMQLFVQGLFSVPFFSLLFSSLVYFFPFSSSLVFQDSSSPLENHEWGKESEQSDLSDCARANIDWCFSLFSGTDFLKDIFMFLSSFRYFLIVS